MAGSGTRGVPVDELRFRRLFESAPLGAHVYRLDDGGRLVFQGGNPAADRILGIAHAPLVGLRIEEAFPPLAATRLPARYAEIARDGGTWEAEQVDYRDGRISGAFEVHAFQLAPGEMAALFQEITRRKQTEEALRVSEEKYRLLVDAQQDLVIRADPAGWIDYVSPSVCRFFERTEESLRAEPLFALVHPGDRQAVADEIGRALREGGQGQIEHRTTTPRGERWLAWTGRVLLGDEGEPEGFVATGRDVSERREMEERLRQSEKLHAIGQLAGGVAHDFNNQLVGILSSAELLRETLPVGEDRELAETIIASARRSADLTRQLLAFARKSPVRRVPVEVGELLRGVVELLRHTIDRRIALELSIPAGLPAVEGDAAQLHHALLNLALNARDAMPEGGTLRLAARAVPPEEEREGLPADLPPGPLVGVSVEDTGTGIAPEAWPHLFEPFYTTRAQGKGSGLGLAAVYGTVKAHGGALDVRSAPDRGTTFTVWLPAADAAPARTEAPGTVPAARSRRVLVVDDEPRVRSSLERLLRKEGHEVLLAEGGREGLEIHTRECGRIDVVFLDLTMPDLPGGEVFRRLREAEPGLPVVLATGWAAEGEAERLGAEAGVEVLQKPFDRADVLRVLAKIRRP